MSLNYRKRNKGFALITVIIFAAALSILAATMYIVLNRSTKFSGEYMNFNSVKEAADTGVNIAINLLDNYKTNNPGLGIVVNNSICGGDFRKYVVLSSPEDITCLNEVKSTPWIKINKNNYEISIYIIKQYQTLISGAGGVASFPPSAGTNVSKYYYYFKIISVAENTKNGQRIVGEGLYRVTALD